ncbi:MAG: DUF2283 domain-containing protein [Candidatus Doudnabacteria bacterium]|nr:DUF2283 domain-containing protein [Candidatus Doudnabacteria bacterium]
MKLYYYYDKQADVMYFSQGKPSKSSLSVETADDVVIRLDPKTKAIKGFTILNFSKRLKTDSPISLPIEAILKPV